LDQTYDALVLEPELNARALLKQCIYSLGQFRRIVPARDFVEAKSLFLNGESLPCVVYVSTKFGSAEVMNFIGHAKEQGVGKQSRFVVVLKKEDQTQTSVAQNLISGADALLCEPFSMESVRTTSSFAMQIRSERKREVMTSAFGLLIDEMIADINRLAAIEKTGRRAENVRARLKSLAAPLKSLTPEWAALYQKLAVETLLRVKAPAVAELSDAA